MNPTRRPRLPLFEPEATMVDDIRRLFEIRETVNALKAEEADLKTRLDALPDGVRVRSPELDADLLRTRPSLTAKIVSLPDIEPQFLKPTLNKRTALTYFRSTGVIPTGIDITEGRGSLQFRTRR